MRSETEVSCSCGLVSERVLALTPTTLSVLQPAVNISAPKCIATSIPGPPNFASPSVNRRRLAKPPARRVNNPSSVRQPATRAISSSTAPDASASAGLRSVAQKPAPADPPAPADAVSTDPEPDSRCEAVPQNRLRGEP